MDKLEDQRNTCRITDTINTASGTAKMDGNAQGVETTHAEAECHFHSYSLGHLTPLVSGADDSQMISTQYRSHAVGKAYLS